MRTYQFFLADKNTGLRTHKNPLPEKRVDAIAKKFPHLMKVKKSTVRKYI